MRLVKLIIVTCSLLIILNCCGGEVEIMEETKYTKASVYVTTADQSKLLHKEADISVEPRTGPFDKKLLTFDLKYKELKQQMDGFGASMTDSSAYLIMEVLNDDERAELMKKLFSYDEGIGVSFLKQPMGASDYALKLYTYNDIPINETDLSLERFDIGYEREHVIPALKLAYEVNPDIKILAMPWSPPRWMKSNKSMFNGTLKNEYLSVYADYFVKFIDEYEKEGIPIYAVSPIGEPLRRSDDNPGCYMPAEQQATFIGEHLGPALESTHPDVKIMCFSHNWDTPEYVDTVYAKAWDYTDGAAWHSYGGRGSTMVTMLNKYPEKGNWFTESSGGDWIPSFSPAFRDQSMHITRTISQYAKSLVWWNLALDENRGPSILNNSTCRGLVEINSETHEITYNVDYYTLGHISKFVRPGAYRINTNTYRDNVESSAFINPDDSLVLILHNWNRYDKSVGISIGSDGFTVGLSADSVTTIVID